MGSCAPGSGARVSGCRARRSREYLRLRAAGRHSLEHLRLRLRYERLRAAGRHSLEDLRLRLRYEYLRAAGRRSCARPMPRHMVLDTDLALDRGMQFAAGLELPAARPKTATPWHVGRLGHVAGDRN